MVDRFFELSGGRASYVTECYVAAEVVSAFRSARGSRDALELFRDIVRSDLVVQHGPDRWDVTDLSESPRAVMAAVGAFLAGYPDHDVSLRGAIHILQGLVEILGKVQVVSVVSPNGRASEVGSAPIR